MGRAKRALRGKALRALAKGRLRPSLGRMHTKACLGRTLHALRRTLHPLRAKGRLRRAGGHTKALWGRALWPKASLLRGKALRGLRPKTLGRRACAALLFCSQTFDFHGQFLIPSFFFFIIGYQGLYLGSQLLFFFLFLP